MIPQRPCECFKKETINSIKHHRKIEKIKTKNLLLETWPRKSFMTFLSTVSWKCWDWKPDWNAFIRGSWSCKNRLTFKSSAAGRIGNWCVCCREMCLFVLFKMGDITRAQSLNTFSLPAMIFLVISFNLMVEKHRYRLMIPKIIISSQTSSIKFQIHIQLPTQHHYLDEECHFKHNVQNLVPDLPPKPAPLFSTSH